MRRTRSVALVLVVVAAATAGCWGDGEFPPGASEDGLDSSLAEAHNTALLEHSSFTYEVSTVRRVGGDLREVEYRLRADLADGEYLDATTVGNTSVESYYANGTRYRKRTTPGGTTYDATGGASPPVARVLDLNETVERLVESADFSYEGTESADDTTLYVYAASDVNASLVTSFDASNATARLAVGPDGVVRRMAFAFTVQTRDGPREVTTEVRVTDVDASEVSAPSWLDEARDGS